MKKDRNKNLDGLDFYFNKCASEIIKEHRIKSGYTMEELGDKLNPKYSKQAMYMLEHNKCNIKLETFKQICLALDLEPADVFNEISIRTISAVNNSDMNSLK